MVAQRNFLRGTFSTGPKQNMNEQFIFYDSFSSVCMEQQKEECTQYTWIVLLLQLAQMKVFFEILGVSLSVCVR